MPSFNFKPEFAGKVKRNTKPGTIRPRRKRPMKVGDMMHCYTGMRTEKCKRIISRKCVAIVDITIRDLSSSEPFIELDGKPLDVNQSIQFAEDDGFDFFSDFLQFFNTNYGLPFTGHWYVWKESALDKYHITSHIPIPTNGL